MESQEGPRILPASEPSPRCEPPEAKLPARRIRIGRGGTYGWVIGEPPLLRLTPEDRLIWRQQTEFTLRELGLDPGDVFPANPSDRQAFDRDLG